MSRFAGHRFLDVENERAIKMPRTNASFGAAVIVGLAMSLIEVNSCAQAPQAPVPLIRNNFVTVGP